MTRNRAVSAYSDIFAVILQMYFGAPVKDHHQALVKLKYVIKYLEWAQKWCLGGYSCFCWTRDEVAVACCPGVCLHVGEGNFICFMQRRVRLLCLWVVNLSTLAASKWHGQRHQLTSGMACWMAIGCCMWRLMEAAVMAVLQVSRLMICRTQSEACEHGRSTMSGCWLTHPLETVLDQTSLLYRLLRMVSSQTVTAHIVVVIITSKCVNNLCPSVLRCCWLGDRKGSRVVKTCYCNFHKLNICGLTWSDKNWNK